MKARPYLIGVLMLATLPMLSAQPRLASLPWWENPLATGLTLTDAQRTRVQEILREARDPLADLRAEVEQAEAALEAIFNEDSVDERRGTAAIDRLARRRADLTRAVSEMTLKLRAVLTTEQWQELQRVIAAGERGRGGKRGRPPLKGGATPQATSNKR